MKKKKGWRVILLFYCDQLFSIDNQTPKKTKRIFFKEDPSWLKSFLGRKRKHSLRAFVHLVPLWFGDTGSLRGIQRVSLPFLLNECLHSLPVRQLSEFSEGNKTPQSQGPERVSRLIHHPKRGLWLELIIALFEWKLHQWRAWGWITEVEVV